MAHGCHWLLWRGSRWFRSCLRAKTFVAVSSKVDTGLTERLGSSSSRLPRASPLRQFANCARREDGASMKAVQNWTQRSDDEGTTTPPVAPHAYSKEGGVT